MAKSIPVIEQYQKKKAEYNNAILFFQIGEFYEMFFDDAKLVSEKLGLTQTEKKWNGETIPMCGIPVKSASVYAPKLVRMGYRVAVCSQIMQSGNVTAREIEIVHTPGTTIDESILPKESNFLCAVYMHNNKVELAFIDISTSEFYLHQMDEIKNLILKYNPKEVLINKTDSELEKFLSQNSLPKPEVVNGTCAASLIENYLNYLKLEINLDKPKTINSSDFLKLDASVIKNLEIFKSLGESSHGTLFSVLNHCKTAMGERKLSQFLKEPLVDKERIEARQKCVKEFAGSSELTNRVREALDGMPDFERLVSKLSTKFFSFANLQKLKKAVSIAQSLKNLLPHYTIGDLKSLDKFLEDTIDGDKIAHGFHEELDDARNRILETEELIENYIKAQAHNTQIKNLEQAHLKTLGYFMEIPLSEKEKVPFEFRLIQTVGTTGRYTSEILTKYSELLLTLTNLKEHLEAEAFDKIKFFLQSSLDTLAASAKAVKLADVYSALAIAAVQNNYVCPVITKDDNLTIKNGRHPVVEKFVNFSANDTRFDGDTKIMLITGPNMAGKSTYMRQVALIVIMAQIGSFVPAESAEIGITSEVFTRIGAGDDISSGNSTFMIEMKEVANILNKATPKSLVILDEIGRGTASSDGISIAKACIDFLSKTGAKIMFATHFHEIHILEEKYKPLKNFSFGAVFKNKEISFTYKLESKPSSNSYGIEIAKLAGVPQDVIEMAKNDLKNIQTND